MTGPTRTLPLRVPPLPGEALDSWLEVLAHRHQAPLGDLVDRIAGAHAPRRGRRSPLPTWTVALPPRMAASITAITETPETVVHGLTLTVFHGRALTVDHQRQRVIPYTLWGRSRGSRFCPSCLQETSGRWRLSWRLSWRLGWTFACERHHCLLADTCPGCHRLQRVRACPEDLPPRPGRCAETAPGGLGRSAARCAIPLSDRPTLALGPGQAAVHAQQLLLEAIDTGTAGFGVYADQPQPVSRALNDLRALAKRVLAHPDLPGLGRLLPGDLLTAYHAEVRRRHERHKAPANAARPGQMARPVPRSPPRQ